MMKMKEDTAVEMGDIIDVEVHRKRELRPSHFRYFNRGQNEKPSDGDFFIMRPKKVKVSEHDKLLNKFRHKEALICALKGKNPENVVAVMEELVARRKLLTCVINLETEELGLLLGFLQRHTTMPRYAGLLMGLAKKVIEMRAEDVEASDELNGHIRNLKRSVKEEIRIQQSMQEIQGELRHFYRLTPIAAIGGSFLPGLTGHNIAEAAAAGCAVLTGHHVGHFFHMALEMQRINPLSVLQVAGKVELCEVLTELLSNAKALEAHRVTAKQAFHAL